MTTGWWIGLIVGNTVLAVFFALVYAVLYPGIPGRGIRKGLVWGFIVWLIGVVPATFTLWALTHMAPGTLIYFTSQGFFEYLFYGAAVAVVYGREPTDAVEESGPVPGA
ncbi:MAG: hypothetical protein ACYTAF_15300 [Planctomycetota bacterium]|jgi:hypothetical protein